MNGKQLKNSILQWAIQGKLVPQDPNDEPASVLLGKIRQEKERLIKEKKIKRDKNASIIYRDEDNSYYEKILATGEVKCIDEEVPFEIPQGWEWCRIRNISQSYIGLTYSPSEVSSQGTIVLRSSNIQDGRIVFDDIVRVTKNISEKLLVEKNDIIICARNGSAKLVGKSAIVTEITEPMTFGAFMAICKTSLYQYVSIFLQSDLFFSQLRGVSGTTTINQLTQSNFNNFLITIPPLEEQHRIFEKVNDVLPIVEIYGNKQEQLDKLNDNLRENFKKSILQEAIQGKLVPQIAEEGTAQELLKQIKAEKQKLVKEGKLKKSALNDSVIFRGDDNKYYEQIGKKCLDITEQIPFDLPESWSWARGMSVFMPMESTKPSSDFVYIDVDAVNNRLNIIDNPKKVRFENAPSRATRKLHKNDLLFSMVRPYLKNIALVDDIYIDAIASTGFYVITPSLGYYPMFLFYLMLSNYVVDGLNSFMKGDNSPSINNCHIEDYLYPLPPIEEQKRIVNKIEQLFKQLR
ncbi:MAG: restriction endonuclease subunit S [Bacteroidales bacterium]